MSENYIEKFLEMSISGKTAKLSETFYLHKGDKDIRLNIKILDTSLKSKDRQNMEGYILVDLPEGSYAKVALVQPTKQEIVRERIPIESGYVKFVITE